MIKFVFVFYLILNILFLSCALNQAIPSNPTGNDKLDIYLSKWVESINITACERVLDLENDIDAVLCVETETDRRIHIPFKAWEEMNLEDLFLRVSKKDLRLFLSKNKNLRDLVCEELGLDCSEDAEYPIMPELTPFVEAK